MKTFAMTAIAATMVAGSAFAHPVNEPHICGIDPTMVMDWPGFAQEDGTIYDRGDYFFVATNDNGKPWVKKEYTTTHTRIWKDSMEHNGVCRVTGVDIFHADDDAAGGSMYLVFAWDAETFTVSASYNGETISIDFDDELFSGLTEEELADGHSAVQTIIDAMNEAAMELDADEVSEAWEQIEEEDLDQAEQDINAIFGGSSSVEQS